jgi:hypothetical protein
LAAALGIRGANRALEKALGWFDSVTDKNGVVGYQARGDVPASTFALTAAALAGRLLAKAPPKKSIQERQTALVSHGLVKMNEGKEQLDYYFLHFGALAACLSNARMWEKWCGLMNEVLKKACSRLPSVCIFESPGRWTAYGGRLYNTAMALLAVQSCYRYPS